MSKFRFTLNILAVTAFLLTITSIANAQATRTWVSGVGDDVNPCSRTAPCKTYAGAISKTAKDGEISTLDPGGFGAVTITKSITINGGGGGQGYGSILASGTTGIIINITDPLDVRKTVRLDWLNINGASTGLDGIRFLAGSALHVENCLIDGFTGQGIDISSTSAGLATEVYVRNTTIRNCVTDGVRLTHSSVVVVSSFNNVDISNCGNGINIADRARATVRDSTFHSNNTAAINNTTATSEASLFHCAISNNITGIAGGTAPSIARVSDCLIYGNSTGVSGNAKSWGNNYLDGNAANGAFVLPNLTQL